MHQPFCSPWIKEQFWLSNTFHRAAIDIGPFHVSGWSKLKPSIKDWSSRCYFEHWSYMGRGQNSNINRNLEEVDSTPYGWLRGVQGSVEELTADVETGRGLELEADPADVTELHLVYVYCSSSFLFSLLLVWNIFSHSFSFSLCIFRSEVNLL